MKKIVLLVSLFLSAVCATVYAETDCPDYKITTSFIRDTLRFDLSQNGAIEPPRVDSVWITDGSDDGLPLFVGVVQSQEPIDLSYFEQGYYLLRVLAGDCLYDARFGKWIPWKGCNDADIACSVRVINPHRIVLSVMDTAANQPVVWDSLWITNQGWRMKPEVLVAANSQAGDTVDIAPMVGIDFDVFTCWIQIGECLRQANFMFNGLAWDPCLEFQDFTVYVQVQDVQRTKIIYNVVPPENMELPLIDSVWVENTAHEVVLVAYARPEEMIDISSLPYGLYNLNIPLGDCLVGRTFFVRKRNTDQAIDDVPATPAARKILRNGQICIIRGDKTYTLQGQELK